MNRYPHTISIYRHTNQHNPYEDDVYTSVYSGECNCFQKKTQGIPTGEKALGVNEFCAVIPNPSMPEIGENYKVIVGSYVGYVTYFRRFSRVCEVYFQQAKEETPAEDIPTYGTESTENQEGMA